MAAVKVINTEAKVVGEVELDPRVFEVESHPTVVQEVVRSQLAVRRRGTASTKTRSEVRLTGAKLWRQKGTGRARHGSRRAPIFVGGGVAFGPRPRDYSFKPPKKVRRAALKMALSERAREEGGLLVMEDFDLPEIRTRDALAVLDPLVGDRTVLVVLPKEREKTALSLRNLPGVSVMAPDRINVYDILRHEVLVMTRASLESVTEALSSWTRT